MTPQQLIRAWALRADASPEVTQEDDGSGYSVITIVTKYGEFNVSVDSEFVNIPQGIEEAEFVYEEALRLRESDSQ